MKLITTTIVSASLILIGCTPRSTVIPVSSIAGSRKVNPSRPEAKVFSGQINPAVLAKANGDNTRIVIDIGAQKCYLLVANSIAVASPVSTGKSGHPTPTGTFKITERVRSGKISTIYNVSMPYWMRLDDLPFGIHGGVVPGYPASAGCIRLPHDVAPIFYENTKSGTQVSIYQNWPAANH